jgi:archaellum component FlaF (FlaF/FlaG flagellin family)
LIIAAAILLSTLITTVGTRYAAIETSNEEIAWLVDRLTGNVYKCRAEVRGKASCDADVSTGSIPQPKR